MIIDFFFELSEVRIVLWHFGWKTITDLW